MSNLVKNEIAYNIQESTNSVNAIFEQEEVSSRSVNLRKNANVYNKNENDGNKSVKNVTMNIQNICLQIKYIIQGNLVLQNRHQIVRDQIIPNLIKLFFNPCQPNLTPIISQPNLTPSLYLSLILLKQIISQKHFSLNKIKTHSINKKNGIQMLSRLIRDSKQQKIRGVISVWKQYAKWQFVERRVQKIEGNFKYLSQMEWKLKGLQIFAKTFIKLTTKHIKNYFQQFTNKCSTQNKFINFWIRKAALSSPLTLKTSIWRLKSYNEQIIQQEAIQLLVQSKIVQSNMVNESQVQQKQNFIKQLQQTSSSQQAFLTQKSGQQSAIQWLSQYQSQLTHLTIISFLSLLYQQTITTLLIQQSIDLLKPQPNTQAILQQQSNCSSSAKTIQSQQFNQIFLYEEETNQEEQHKILEEKYIRQKTKLKIQEDQQYLTTITESQSESIYSVHEIQ